MGDFGPACEAYFRTTLPHHDVIETQLAYLRAIGAVGDAARPDAGDEMQG